MATTTQSLQPSHHIRTVTGHRFEKVLNIRDVGKTINQITGEKYKPKIIAYQRRILSPKDLCIDQLDDATLSDRRYLRDEYGITTIMDLRTKTEHARQAKKRQEELNIRGPSGPNDPWAEPSKIPGVDYVEININGKGFERSLVRRLSVWKFFKLIILMLLGYRMEAISILGREVMQPRGLIGLGYDSIDHCGAEIAQALHEFASSERYPILVHCTQGKDRTGLLIALILFLLDIPLVAITYDYCLSESELLAEREARLSEIKEIGLTEDFADTPKDWIPSMHRYLRQKYEGPRGYLKSIGLDEDSQARIAQFLGRSP